LYWAQDISTRYLAVELLMISNLSVSCHCIALDLTQDRVLSLPGFGVNIFKKGKEKMYYLAVKCFSYLVGKYLLIKLE
jgi:hypothetical protein